jgi:hypothetical protein
MGLLWRLLAPKPLKKARRSLRRVAHPIGALTPIPVKNVRRVVYTTAHPVSAASNAVERAIGDALTGKLRKRSSTKRATRSTSPIVAADGASSAQVRAWARRNGYRVADKGRLPKDVLTAYHHAHSRR